jgi:single-strand DNA-binding protein
MSVQVESTNYVRLKGLVAGDVVERTLSSGEVVAAFRINVGRDPAPQQGASSDTIDCVATPVRLRRSLQRLKQGSGIVVEGSLHRRYFRSGGSLVSRYEVDIHSLTRTTA